jgi:hypothetical protein
MRYLVALALLCFCCQFCLRRVNDPDRGQRPRVGQDWFLTQRQFLLAKKGWVSGLST